MKVSPHIRKTIFPILDQIIDKLIAGGMDPVEACTIIAAHAGERMLDEMPAALGATAMQGILNNPKGKKR